MNTYEKNIYSDLKFKWDDYCWKCHRKCDSALNCTSCVRSFHTECTEGSNRCNPIEWRCVECKSNEKIDSDDNQKRFEYIVEHALRQTFEKRYFDVPYDYTSELLINPIQIDEIVDRCKGNKYVNTHDLLLDFKWLYHNCKILYSNGAEHEKKRLVKTRDFAKILLKNVEKEIDRFQKCADCYVHNHFDDTFCATFVCSKPHIIVWARFNVYPYWPAKIMADVENSKKLEVLFFGAHNSAKVQHKSCFLYCNQDPNNYANDRYKEEIKVAIEEANRYIQNVEKKFGVVQLPSTFVTPIPGKLDVHFDEIYSGYFNEKRTNSSKSLKSQASVPLNVLNLKRQHDDDNKSIDGTVKFKKIMRHSEHASELDELNEKEKWKRDAIEKENWKREYESLSKKYEDLLEKSTADSLRQQNALLDQKKASEKEINRLKKHFETRQKAYQTQYNEFIALHTKNTEKANEEMKRSFEERNAECKRQMEQLKQSHTEELVKQQQMTEAAVAQLDELKRSFEERNAECKRQMEQLKQSHTEELVKQQQMTEAAVAQLNELKRTDSAEKGKWEQARADWNKKFNDLLNKSNADLLKQTQEKPEEMAKRDESVAILRKDVTKWQKKYSELKQNYENLHLNPNRTDKNRTNMPFQTTSPVSTPASQTFGPTLTPPQTANLGNSTGRERNCMKCGRSCQMITQIRHCSTKCRQEYFKQQCGIQMGK